MEKLVYGFKEIVSLMEMPDYSGDGQMNFGGFVEHNLIAALSHYGSGASAKVIKSSKKHDYLFGCDLKVLFEQPLDESQDGLASYVDITLNKQKANVLWLGTNNGYHFFNKSLSRFPSQTEYATKLEDGTLVYFGLKTRNMSKFFYKKPVLVICLVAAPGANPCCNFSPNDSINILKSMRDVIYHVSYVHRFTWNGATVVGAGKSASEQVSLSPRYKDILGL